VGEPLSFDEQKSVLSHAPLVGERLGDEMRELLGEPLSVDCNVGISDRIRLELIPALGQPLGPPLGQPLLRSTLPTARA
jgi:hypothetical protein